MFLVEETEERFIIRTGSGAKTAVQVFPNELLRNIGEKHIAVLAALGVFKRDRAVFPVQIGGSDAAKAVAANSGSHEQGEDGAVAGVSGHVHIGRMQIGQHHAELIGGHDVFVFLAVGVGDLDVHEGLFVGRAVQELDIHAEIEKALEMGIVETEGGNSQHSRLFLLPGQKDGGSDGFQRIHLPAGKEIPKEAQGAAVAFDGLIGLIACLAGGNVGVHSFGVLHGGWLLSFSTQA